MRARVEAEVPICEMVRIEGKVVPSLRAAFSEADGLV